MVITQYSRFFTSGDSELRLSFIPAMNTNEPSGWDGSLNHWFSNSFSHNLLDELTVFFPRADKYGVVVDSLENIGRKEIYRAWWQICNLSTGTQLQAWRVIFEHCNEIAPGLRVFRTKNSEAYDLFWFSPCQDLIEMQTRLADLLPKISAYWHCQQERGLFHSAGIIHNEQAYLFVGVSGAGKSTVSSLSIKHGERIIHDDHVVVYRGEDGQWLVSDASHSVQATPIKAIFFLVQSQDDQLLPISTARTAKGLMKSLEEHGKHVLFGDVYRSAFSTCSEIARHVPGYELYFRKSPDFWKLIDERFPD